VPQYIDTLIARYIPDTTTGNEVTEFEQCLFPLQTIIENQLRVYHGGWLYVGACLLFEKKISRDLAAEYIHWSIQNNYLDVKYLSSAIGKFIAIKYAPVNRLIEYMDKAAVSKQVKEFQFQILEQCILQIEKNNKPINTKKIIAAYNEIAMQLQINTKDSITQKINLIK
jgi:hypothetical protein